MYAAVDSTITNCQEAVRIAQEHLPAKSAGEIERIMNVVIAKIEARRETKLDNHAVWLYWMLTPSESNQEFNPSNTARIVSDVTPSSTSSVVHPFYRPDRAGAPDVHHALRR